jgi:hypothetical protein
VIRVTDSLDYKGMALPIVASLSAGETWTGDGTHDSVKDTSTSTLVLTQGI